MKRHFDSVGVPIHIVNTGDIIREQMRTSPEFRRMNAQLLDQGRLLGDNETYDLVSSSATRAKASGSRVLFDGFPRNVNQVQLLASNGWIDHRSLFILFGASNDTLHQRHRHSLSNPQLRGPRTDDGSFSSRVNLFRRSCLSVVIAVMKLGATPYRLDANRPLEQVAQEVIAQISLHLKLSSVSANSCSLFGNGCGEFKNSTLTPIVAPV